MLGPFKPSLPALGGLLWKMPWRMSRFRKYRHRLRMKKVDENIKIVGQGLRLAGIEPVHQLLRLERELPKESEMNPRDKYFVFSRKHKGYRKGAHLQPKWTKISNRVPPPGF